ncbi:general transcription factor 3C polypeptide 1 [Pundamilia nyererei]|uniref:General transcription factor 3C polypeptide 1 n=2 Tax=Pundamilia nyererei TaxID=303518 RepID=A0A9Y3RY40_9CICH|nr:PREDICTED: general transcription factor 3C polypeptide 1 [Pundamilia nyererei]
MDLLSIVVDEVALEGLDGITIPTLWIRLEDRQPGFPLKLDDCTKELIWKSLVINSDLLFYELPEERDDVVLTDRFKDIDAETGIEVTDSFTDTPKDIYPIDVVPENKDGIQGSCAFFKTRKDVTKQVRSKSPLTPLVSLSEALERYGRKLVVVASQCLRYRALIGSESDPDVKLGSDSYCVLERVGRARWQGELQRDLHGGSFKVDARKFHYFRKSLVRYQLVTMQSYVRRMKTGQQQHSILLLLKRFHVNRRTKYDILMEVTSNFLQQCPNQFSTVIMLREQLVNVDDRTYLRLFKYMRASKLIEFCRFPLEELDPSAGPRTNKNGSKVTVRCVRLLKPYIKKGVAEEDDDDDEDEDDDGGAGRGGLLTEGRIMEKDLLTQAYHIILSSGTKGIPQRDIAFRLNVSKLEARMLWRRLEKDGLIKGFMEDEGRQRTTKFISHKCVGSSNQLQLFAKEQERQMLLFSSAPQTSSAEPTSPKTPSSSKAPVKGSSRTPEAKKNKKEVKGRSKEAEEGGQTSEDGKGNSREEGLDGNESKVRENSGARRKTTGENGSMTAEHTQPDVPVMQSAPAECETSVCSKPATHGTPDSVSGAVTAPVEEKEETSSTDASSLHQSETPNAADNAAPITVVVKSIPSPKKASVTRERSHETYRLLRRKNLIVEAVCNLRIIEGLFQLQKMINDDEKQDGVSSKCCKKTIVRLVHCLAREGLLKIYTTTVVQDGMTRKVEMIVHPSIQPNDDRVKQVIEQVRFRISSSSAVLRHAEDRAREQEKEADKKKAIIDDDPDFKPTRVPGLSKTYGFQPKMHRLRMMHTFLWYLIYGHPLRHNCSSSDSTSQSSSGADGSDPAAKPADSKAQQDLKEAESSTPADRPTPLSDSVGTGCDGRKSADSSLSNMEVASGDEGEEQKDSYSQSDMKVYLDEDSWKRFIPPVRVHEEYSSGWAMVGDLLLCLPLSVFVQIIQVTYKVEGLEEYLNDPVKQHHLVRALPARMRRRLLYKRKYIFVFHENLLKLVYMGLLQFGPIEKFMEKDQVFVYLKRNATIVDTTNTEPHYWLVTECLEKPFERRPYVFNTADDLEKYWFDLMCVCLNTPLGVVRCKRNTTDEETTPSFVQERHVFAGMAYLLKGSTEVCDDGLIPGDGKGAGGLDSEFFGHLKRNWFWTNQLLSVNMRQSGLEAQDNKTRLKSLLSKDALRFALKAGGTATPRYVTSKRPARAEKVQVGIEPASRNQRVVGGKGQKRKRTKKDVVKVPRKKKKEPKKRTPAHDETDHQALKRMTRQRVNWTVQEDSLVMLCCVAADLLNSKLKRQFVPHCVVRDLLHAEFEISSDKTSVAVGRRSRYILKNPQTLLNYRICLAEVYQDKSLMSLLEKEKPADPEKPEDCAKVFSEYIRLLRQKFSTIVNAHDLIIPDTKQQLFSRFKVSAIDSGKKLPYKDTLNSTDDIHSVVLHNLIQSTLAMTNNQMKTSRSFQIFHLYSQYDQELLCKVFIQCRKRGLVNRRRISQQFGPKKNRALPILPMSYQLSQSYFRCFSWRFPHSLCTDSFRFLRSLIDNGTHDDRPIITLYNETEYRSQNEEEVLETKTGSKSKEHGGKEADRPASEPERAKDVTTKEGDDNQGEIKGDESIKDADTNNEKTDVSSKPDEQKKPDDSSTSGSGEEAPGVSATSNTVPPASDEPPDVSDMLKFSLQSPGGACLVSLSLMSLGLLNVYASIPKQMVVVDSNLVDKDVVKSMAELVEEEEEDDDDGDDYDGKKRQQVKAQKASHTKYLMMRGYCTPGIVKVRNLNTNDSIVMESCIMRLQLRNTPAHSLFSEENFAPLDLTKCGPSLLPSNLTSFVRSASFSPPSVEECYRRFVNQKGYTPRDIEACTQIMRSLDEAGERGWDAYDFLEAHANLLEPQSGRSRKLQQYMQELEEEGQVVKVGSLSVRWVLMKLAGPWLLTVSSKHWSQSSTASHPFLEKKQTIPFIRKRCSREFQVEKEEPPAKRLAVDREDVADKEDVDGVPSNQETNEEKQLEQLERPMERADESRGDQLLLMEEEGGKQIQEEEKQAAERKKTTDTERRQDNRKEQRLRRGRKDDENNDEACSSSTGPDTDAETSFISRPWRLVDGKVNRQVCKGMLEAVLYHIMSQPGLTHQALVEHYKDLLQPVAVQDLVQALIELGCVTKKTLAKSPKPSLFTRPAQQRKSEREPDIVMYEPTISCCLRLCRVLPNERTWNCCIP